MRVRNILAIGSLLLLTACASLYTTTVTITTVVDSAMKDWAQMSVQGRTSPAIDAAVIGAHNKYRAACATAKTALEAYKISGDAADYVKALTAVRAAVDELFAFITPLLAPSEATRLQTDLEKAKTL